MEEVAIRDSMRLKELEGLFYEIGEDKKRDYWNYNVYLIDYEDTFFKKMTVSFIIDSYLIREYAKLLLADHDYRYLGVEVKLGNKLIYKDFRYDNIDRHY